MDQDSLVIDRIEAGRKFLSQLEKSLPVTIAFWLKSSEEGRWRLYVASEKIDDANIGQGYGEVLRSIREMQDPEIDPFQIKLVGVDDPVARAALEVRAGHPGSRRILHREGQLGGMSVEGVSIYPSPITVPNP